MGVVSVAMRHGLIQLADRDRHLPIAERDVARPEEARRTPFPDPAVPDRLALPLRHVQSGPVEIIGHVPDTFPDRGGRFRVMPGSEERLRVCTAYGGRSHCDQDEPLRHDVSVPLSRVRERM